MIATWLTVIANKQDEWDPEMTPEQHAMKVKRLVANIAWQRTTAVEYYQGNHYVQDDLPFTPGNVKAAFNGAVSNRYVHECYEGTSFSRAYNPPSHIIAVVCGHVVHPVRSREIIPFISKQPANATFTLTPLSVCPVPDEHDSAQNAKRYLESDLSRRDNASTADPIIMSAGRWDIYFQKASTCDSLFDLPSCSLEIYRACVKPNHPRACHRPSSHRALVFVRLHAHRQNSRLLIRRRRVTRQLA